jgi:DNA mismatch endonuclease (patch repair protein)
MSIHPRRDTGPEMAVRRLLHAQGLRYRVCIKVPGAPRRTIDIAFTRAKLAVFIDGCFWHGCPDHAQVPSANRDWWITKLEKNRTRDMDTTRLLESAGWTVLRAWEHDHPAAVAELIRTVITDGRQPSTEPRRDLPAESAPHSQSSSPRTPRDRR